MKLDKEIIIKDAKSIAKVIDLAINQATECYNSYDRHKSLQASMKTLSDLLKETE